MDKGHNYEICIEGHITPQWSEWFDGMVISHETKGKTVLEGLIVDQAALLGVLSKIHSLNLTILYVIRKQ